MKTEVQGTLLHCVRCWKIRQWKAIWEVKRSYSGFRHWLFRTHTHFNTSWKFIPTERAQVLYHPPPLSRSLLTGLQWMQLTHWQLSWLVVKESGKKIYIHIFVLYNFIFKISIPYISTCLLLKIPILYILNLTLCLHFTVASTVASYAAVFSVASPLSPHKHCLWGESGEWQ